MSLEKFDSHSEPESAEENCLKYKRDARQFRLSNSRTDSEPLIDCHEKSSYSQEKELSVTCIVHDRFHQALDYRTYHFAANSKRYDEKVVRNVATLVSTGPGELSSFQFVRPELGY